MNINLNIPIALLQSLIKSLERIATAYETVHADALTKVEPTDEPFKFFYQSDKELYEQEQREKAEAEARG